LSQDNVYEWVKASLEPQGIPAEKEAQYVTYLICSKVKQQIPNEKHNSKLWLEAMHLRGYEQSKAKIVVLRKKIKRIKRKRPIKKVISKIKIKVLNKQFQDSFDKPLPKYLRDRLQALRYGAFLPSQKRTPHLKVLAAFDGTIKMLKWRIEEKKALLTKQKTISEKDQNLLVSKIFRYLFQLYPSIDL